MTNIEQKVDKNSASISSLTEWKDNTSVSMTNIEQKVDKNSASISSLTEWTDGIDSSMALIQQKADDNSASISSLVSYTDDISSSVADISQKVDANGASIGLVVESGVVGSDGKVQGSILIDAINTGETVATINANKINLNGYVTISDLGAEGKTTIHGNRIETGTLSADRLESHSITTDQLDVDQIVLGGWKITSSGFTSEYDESFYLTSGGRLGCDKATLVSLDVSSIYLYGDIGDLENYLARLANRVAKLETYHGGSGSHTHTWGGWTTTKEATCTTEGTQTRSCSSCNEKDTKSISKLGHKWNAATATCKRSGCGATCGHGGATSGTCTICGYVISGGGTDPTDPCANGHSWDSGAITKDATCTETGVKMFTCTRPGCNETKTEPIDKLGHNTKMNYEQDTDDGVNYYHRRWVTCSNCDYEKRQPVENCTLQSIGGGRYQCTTCKGICTPEY
jgi:hypothetical protein